MCLRKALGTEESWVLQNSRQCHIFIVMFFVTYFTLRSQSFGLLSYIHIIYHPSSHYGVVNGSVGRGSEPEWLPWQKKKTTAGMNWKTLPAKVSLLFLQYKNKCWHIWLLQPPSNMALCALSHSHATDKNDMPSLWQQATKHSWVRLCGSWPSGLQLNENDAKQHWKKCQLGSKRDQHLWFHQFEKKKKKIWGQRKNPEFEGSFGVSRKCTTSWMEN